MTGGRWIYEASAAALGEYPVFPIWLSPRHKPDSNEKHKHLHCGPETVQWRLLCNSGAFPGFFFLFSFFFFFSVASSNCTYSKLARSVLWRNDFGREWLKRTSWFTTLDYCRAVQSGCVPGVMMGRDPPLCLSHSWAPPAVGAGRPDMPPCWV